MRHSIPSHKRRLVVMAVVILERRLWSGENQARQDGGEFVVNSLQDETGLRLRKTIYVLLAVTALGAACGRILQVRAGTGESPMLSANDRSRWCTIAALVNEGTYAIDSLIERRHPETKRRHWYSIDMVRHRAADGKEHAYSSKPPLLPTLLAGEYWLIKNTLGLDIVEHPFYVMRAMLLITNGLLLVLYFWLMAGVIERLGMTDWGRIVAFAIVTCGTLVTTYAVTLSNHLPAAVAVLAAVVLGERVRREAGVKLSTSVFAGLAAGFAVANELPALSLLALLGGWIWWQTSARTFVGYAGGCLLVAVAFFGTNYAAHGTWKPAYAHRHDGDVIVEVGEEERDSVIGGVVPSELVRKLADEAVPISDDATISRTATNGRLMLWDEANQRRLALIVQEESVQVRAWGNWYDYPKSYWLNPQGVDRGEASRLVYATHMLVGHHGVFSLTPVWLFSVLGAFMCLRTAPRDYWFWGAACACLTLVCMAFYVARPLQDRNYGGVNCGFRWLIWLVPIWTISLLPVLDKIASKGWWKTLAYCALLVSVISASYAAMNPWSHPWIFDFWTFLGWLAP